MNALFTEIAETIYTYTNRPDLVAETTALIKKVLLKAHAVDDFAQDTVIVQAPTYALDDGTYSIDISVLPFVRLRKILGITDYPVLNGCTKYEPLSATDLFDSYGSLRANVYYRTGNLVTLRGDNTAPTSPLNVTYSQFPDTNLNTSASWIARDFPSLVVEEVTGQIFKMVGKDTEFARFAQLSAENYKLLIASNIVGV